MDAPSLRADRRSPLPLLLALALLTFVCAIAAREMSYVIDGQRYYFLDDDQMISMRYARNLARGVGLVWNAGEHVEGYTNFGWVLVMSAVHALGTPDRLASLVVKAINWALACVVVLLSDRLFGKLAPGASSLLRACVLLSVALSVDLLFWATNGFETTLLTVLFLWALVRTLDDAVGGAFSPWTCLIAGVLPLVRSDCPDLSAIVVVTGLGLGLRRRWWAVALAGLPFVAHLLFRHAYYGDWLPNTYYLKVAGRSGLAMLGLGYAKGFVAAYPTAIVLAGAALVSSPDRRVRWLLVPLALIGVRLMLVGADMFEHSRFVAPALPVLLVTAAAGIATMTVAGSAAQRSLAAVLAASTLFVSGVSGTKSLLDLQSFNGRPAMNAVTGVMIDRFTRPDARIAVFAAGSVGYFGHRYTLDMLGKTDREIAHMPPHPGAPIGHNHFDFDRTLARRPDLIVSFSTAVVGQNAQDVYQYFYSYNLIDYRLALLTNPVFLAHYQPNLLPIEYLRSHNAIYVSDASPELARLGTWRLPELQ